MTTSQLRKQLQMRQREASELLRLLKQRPPLIRGSVYRLRRKCGKAICRCQQGHLHESWVLSVPEKGRKRMRVVPRGKRLKWQQMTDRYRRFRRARARLVKLFAEMMRLVDEVERERTVPPPQ
jgi:hypothetical protein